MKFNFPQLLIQPLVPHTVSHHLIKRHELKQQAIAFCSKEAKIIVVLVPSSVTATNQKIITKEIAEIIAFLCYLGYVLCSHGRNFSGKNLITKRKDENPIKKNPKQWGKTS